jgi:exodeoxyribonuclease V alpha subunit
VRTIATDPFRLARDVHGVGFKTADRIARATGIVPDAPERVRAALLHVLRELAVRGDTRAPEEQLAKQAATLLGLVEPDPLGGDPVASGIADLIGQRQIVATAIDPANDLDGQGGRLLADARLAAAEAGIAERLRLLAGEEGRTLLAHAADRLAWDGVFGSEVEGHRLTEEQDAAVRTALRSPISIVTGGPGTGKTHTLRAILAAARGVGARVMLAAPTGRAAKRMREATDADARTIHRLLELRYGGAGTHGPGNPLAVDCLIVDEASMLDVPLAHRLLRAVPPGAHVVLVGDPDQLPSVGPGNVLADLIDSGCFPLTRLTHVFRHGAGSGIALSARAVNRGRVPPPRMPTDDYFFIRRDDPESAAATVAQLVTERIPSRLGCAPAEVQVLAPMHRGVVGVTALNARLQAALNPRGDGAEARWRGRAFRTGDRVLQLKNDYQLSVFNGEMGTVAFVDAEERELGVTLDDGRIVRYPYANLATLSHAYAVSVHKAQGAEFPAVVVPILTTHALALNRTLLYTALTRARQMVVVVGQQKALEMAVDNWNSRRRMTALLELLRGPVEPTGTLTLADDELDWDDLLADDEDAMFAREPR